ncbi:MAG: TldD/PmbA family protein [Lysobacterales bacterium]
MALIDRDVHRIWAPMGVTVIDKASGKFRSRAGLSSPRGMGYEYLEPDPAERFELPGGAVVYRNAYDMKADAIAAAKQVKEKLMAKSVKPGKYDLVLDPSHTWLTIHESVGHPLELDRVLGYEANYAGTSFATMDKREAHFQYGSDKVNIVADKTQPGSLGAVGWDDEGVKCKQWDLIKGPASWWITKPFLIKRTSWAKPNPMAVAMPAHRQRAVPAIGQCVAESEPSKLSPAEMIKGVENGIYIIGDGSFSIDQQRYNAQFVISLFYEIKNGKITGQIEDVAYQIRTPEFWNACAAVCDQSDYRLGGSFFDGKGQPGQVSAVSHGSATARFNGINVINTARSLG